MDIKIIKFDESSGESKSETKQKYALMKASSSLDPWNFDTWFQMETNPLPPANIPNSTIVSIQAKNLLMYCVPMVEGNPHVPLKDPKYQGIWVQNDKIMRVIDLSFKDYKIPAGVKFKIVALQLWFKRKNGARVPQSDMFNNNLYNLSDSELLRIGNWNYMHPNGVLMGTILTPYPTLNSLSTIMYVTEATPVEQFTRLIDEINRVNQWYLCNQTLLYNPITTPSKILAIPSYKPNSMDPKKYKILVELAKIPNVIVWNGKYALNLMGDLDNLGLTDLFQQSRLIDVSEQLETVRQGYLRRNDMQRQIADTQKQMFEQASLEYLSRMVIGKDFQDLSIKEQKQIRIQNEAKINMIINPNDTHMKLLRSMRQALDSMIDTKKYLKQVWDKIQAEYNIKDVDHMLAPNNSKEKKILCPHFVDQIKQYLALKPSEMGSFDTTGVTEKIVNMWAEKVPINYHYYCRICGELLMVDELEDFNIFGQQTVITSQADVDPVAQRIKSEVSQAVRFVKFAQPRATKNFIAQIVQAVEPEIQKIQLQLQKSKTKSLEDTLYTLIMYINAYIFAMFAWMIISEPTQISWAVSVRGGKADTRAANSLTIAYALIINTKGTLIAKIKDFSSEMIKPILLSAYEYARKLKFSSEETSESEELLASSLMNDPMYHYLYMIYTTTAGHVKYTDFNKLFGQPDLNKVVSSSNMYKNAYAPKPGDYFADSYLELLGYVRQELYRQYVVPLSGLLSAYWDKWKFLRDEDEKRELAQKFINVRPRGILYHISKWYVPKEIFISDIKCPDGQKHDYSLNGARYIFMIEGKETSLSIKDLLKMPDRPKLIRVECSKCKKPELAVSMDTTLQSKLDEQLKQNNFFKYFENRCPALVRENGIHDFKVDKWGFVNDNACTKCGYQTSFSDEKPRDYYGKWHDKMPTPQWVDKRLDDRIDSWEVGKFDKWSITLSSILQLSKYTNIPYNVWINLGLTEHKNFANLKASKINPQSQLSEIDAEARAIKLASYIAMILRIYYLVKNHAKITPPLAIKQILEDEPHEHDFPHILEGFYPQYETYRMTETPTHLCNFLLHTICNTLLSIRNMPAKKMAQKLFQYIVDQIAKSEQLISDLDVTKIFVAAKREDTEAEVEVDEEAYQALGEAADAEEKGTEDPFSLDEVDIQTSNTGADEEEFMD